MRNRVPMLLTHMISGQYSIRILLAKLNSPQRVTLQIDALKTG